MRESLMRVRWLLLIGLGLLLGCGRGSEIPRGSVSGKVSYQGHPVAEGTILFVPIKGTKGPGASAIIKDGQYEVIAGGGVPVGAQRVEIDAFRPLNTPAGQFRRPALQYRQPREQYLPKHYNRESTMEAAIGEGKQTRDFDLK
jgi:hypothetical protein